MIGYGGTYKIGQGFAEMNFIKVDLNWLDVLVSKLKQMVNVIRIP